MSYTVGEMAKLLHVAPSTLRYYDSKGLLPFVERSHNGTRIFKDSDYEWLKIIECLKKTGMELDNIRDFIYMAQKGDETINERLNLFKKQKEIVKNKMSELQEMLDTLEYKCWYYETAKKAGTTAFPSHMTDAEIPERFISIRKKLKNK